MGTTKNKAIRNYHAQQYIQAVFAKRLKEEGFICPDDKLLCWYRIVNREVIHSVCFFSCWSAVPVMMWIGYGVFPTFTEPFYTGDVYCCNRPSDERFYEMQILENGPYHHLAPYASDILVDAPVNEGRGLYTLDQLILPKIENIDTIDKCYHFNQNMYVGQLGYSATLVDEAIFLDDIDSYTKCRAYIGKAIELYTRLHESAPQNTQIKKELERLGLQKRALFEGAREEYLNLLEQHKEKNLRRLSKKLGITL